MNRRDFLKNSAKAVASVSVAVVAAIASAPEISGPALRKFADGGIVTRTHRLFVGDRISESTVTPEQMERIKALIAAPDYYQRPLESFDYYLRRDYE